MAYTLISVAAVFGPSWSGSVWFDEIQLRSVVKPNSTIPRAFQLTGTAATEIPDMSHSIWKRQTRVNSESIDLMKARVGGVPRAVTAGASVVQNGALLDLYTANGLHIRHDAVSGSIQASAGGPMNINNAAGIMIRDVATNSALIRAQQFWIQNIGANSVTLLGGSVAPLSLSVATVWTANANNIDVTVNVSDTSGTNRVLSVYDNEELV